MIKVYTCIWCCVNGPQPGLPGHGLDQAADAGNVVGEAAVIALGVHRPGRGELARPIDRLAEIKQAPPNTAFGTSAGPLPRWVAVVNIVWAICGAVRNGKAWRSTAAAPATCGVAIEVPLIVL